MKDLESEEKIAIDIAKLERNLKQVEDIKPRFTRCTKNDSWINLIKYSID